MNKYTACVGSTVYNENNQLIAKDVNFTLPAVTYQTAEFKALGTVEVPIPQLIDAMETSVTHIGEDAGFLKSLTPGSRKIEARWARSVIDENGNVKTVGCRAAMTVMSKGVPEIGVSVGETSEIELPLAVTRYRLYIDGAEILLVDKLKGICRINGKDYAGDVSNVL